MLNSRNVADLHPVLQRGHAELVRRLAIQGITAVGTSSTYRDHKYQNHLFAQGRTRPGNIVTQARGGQSIHNYRLAFDLFQNIRGREWEHPFFAAAGKIWTEMGGVWGGNWTSFVDRPHFEFTGGLTIRQLQAGEQLPQDAIMPWEQETTVEEEKMNTEPRIQIVSDAPDWAQPTLAKLIANGHLHGKTAGSATGLNLTLDMLRIFVIHDRIGLYDI